MSDHRQFAAQVLAQEAAGITQLAQLLDPAFDAAVEALLACSGHVVVSGVGKPWIIGQKISATLASTGTPSFALHPSDAMHGDLGRLRAQDLVLALSHSGTSEEMVRLLPLVQRVGCRVVGITGVADSPLGRAADILLPLGRLTEACPIGMAPSVSTTAMLALGDALALTVMRARNFGPTDYARFHPGGALGRSLMPVADIMQPLAATATVPATATVADALDAITTHKTGAVFVVTGTELVGVFTDGDLRRHIRSANLLSQPVGEVMTAGGYTVDATALAPAAVRLMQEHRIGELPVVDGARLLGHVALKDLISMNFVA